MLSIEEARARVLAKVQRLPAEEVPTWDSLGRVLAGDVVALTSAPRFDNSAMDGFAALAGPAGRSLDVIGESRAGSPFGAAIGDGQAIRISTGAAVPDGDQVGVLQQELANVNGETVVLTEALEPGRNIRRAGEDLREGEVVLGTGRRIGPAELSVAIIAGARSLSCAKSPRVAIVNTGDELISAGTKLAPGQIHDSNGPTLAALARKAGATVTSIETVRDNAGETRAAILRALLADVVILSGGVSVGPHDHVKEQLRALGVTEDFWRVALRPGKPTWFGTADKTLVFGLPGNPVSAYVTFLLFVRPALRAIQGADPAPDRGTVRLASPIDRHPDRDECVRVTITDGVAVPTGPQGSHVTTSLVKADALAVIERGAGQVAAGDAVTIERL